VKAILPCGYPSAMADLLFLGAFLGLIGYAAISDIRSFRIPNTISLALIALFFTRLFFVLPEGSATAHFLAAVAASAIMAGSYKFGWFGAGDAKLITAILLWTGPGTGLQFVAAAAIAGGVFAAFLLMLRNLFKAHAGLAVFAHFPSLRLWAERGIPYGLPILIAACLVSPYMLQEGACRVP
jgi:prepilin peptidase CpaA